ncbi:MAG: esterase FrsA [bacterium]|nr:esterase FrsA [bacterium]
MSAAPSLYRPLDESPARLTLRDASPARGTGQVFEVVSRGDFVPGRLHRPENGESSPLVLVLGGSDAWSAEAGRPLAIAQIDLPLLGARQSPKLTDRLVDGHAKLTRGQALDADTRALVEEFARQSVSDIVRSLEALGAEPSLDGSRIAIVGVGLGASACAWALPFLSNVRACVFAGPVGHSADAGLDPIGPIARADLGDLRCRVFATDESDAEGAIRALGEALPGRPTTEKVSTPNGEDDVASILDFVTEALAG